MRFFDNCGVEMTIANDKALAHWQEMVEAFLSHSKDTPVALGAVLADDPACVMAWCAKGLFLVLLARHELLDSARAALTEADTISQSLAITKREQSYRAALRYALDHDFTSAIACFETVLQDNPQDSLAAKLSHNMRFMLGDASGMRQSIDSVVMRAGLDHPHIGYLLGCRAFALEETGSYFEAEIIGRRAIDRAPRDAWGLHAVSHVHEMTGRAQEGAEFLRTSAHNITHCNNFAFHVHWHHALFELELGEHERALALYDDKIRKDNTDDFRDIANASSLLLRLEIAGVDVGCRWQALGALVSERLDDGSLVFAGLHYLIALLGAGRKNDADIFAKHFALTPPAVGSYRSNQYGVSHNTGATAAEGLMAYFQGDYTRAADLLLSVRGKLQTIGGSHAQRDIFEQVLLESLVRSSGTRDHQTKARQMLFERLMRRAGHNQFATERLARLGSFTAAHGLAAAHPVM